MRCPAVLLLLIAACGEGATRDPGPRPRPDHREIVREVLDHSVFDARYELAGPSEYHFAEPVPGRVASWHFEPQIDGMKHDVGYHHGWCVDFRVRPRYAGYPEQPESKRMAFFVDGELRGLFSPGTDGAPLELARWHADWTDPSWHPFAAPR